MTSVRKLALAMPIMAVVLLLRIGTAHAIPFTFEFVGDNNVSTLLTFNPDQFPTSVSPVEEGVITATSPVAGRSVFSYTNIVLGVGDQQLVGGSGDIRISRGFDGVPDVYEFDGVVQSSIGNEPFTSTITVRIEDPTLQMAANTVAVTDTIVIDNGVLSRSAISSTILLTAPLIISNTALLGIGDGRYFLQGGPFGAITGTITAIVDRTRQGVSEPSTLLLTTLAFAALAAGARIYRRRSV